MNKDQALADLHATLGWKPLNRTWAKLEILLGLFAVAVAVGLLARPELAWELSIAAVALFVCGGYLALAGSRSHVYQSNNELAAFVVWRVETAIGDPNPPQQGLRQQSGGTP